MKLTVTCARGLLRQSERERERMKWWRQREKERSAVTEEALESSMWVTRDSDH